jgi:phosphoenolpyruvate-protein kinase (PTS system EI component)
MNAIIRCVIIACVLQIGAVVGLGGYLAIRNSNEAVYLSALAQSNAAYYTDATSLRYYNKLQQELSAERDDLHQWVDKRIDLKLYEALKAK